MSVSVVSMMLPSRILTVVFPLFAVIWFPPEVPPGFLRALVLVPPTVASFVIIYSPPPFMLSTLTDLSTTGAVTVTVHVAVLLLAVVTVIVAVPAATAVTVPPLTVATLGSLLVQVSAL